MKRFVEYGRNKTQHGGCFGPPGGWCARGLLMVAVWVIGVGLLPDWGDWCPPARNATSTINCAGGNDQVSCWGYFQGVKVMAQWASMLGKTADADDYNTLVDSVRASWAGKHDAFVSITHGDKSSPGKRDWVQTLNALGLDMEAFGQSSSGSSSAAAVTAIVSDVARAGGHLQTGIIGTKYLLRSLSLNGRADVAWQVASTPTFPGYGYMCARCSDFA